MKRSSGSPPRRGRALLAPAGALLASLAFAPAANAAIVTVGRSLAGPFLPSEADELPFVGMNEASPAGVRFSSPVTGAIVRWNIAGATGTFRLGVLRRSGAAFTLTRRSAPASPVGTGLQSFDTATPIAAGESVGLEVAAGSRVGVSVAAGDESVFWEPPLAEGATQPPTDSNEGSYAFNAEVLPAPTVASIAPATGPTDGGTAVTIAGTDFTGVSAVGFGALPASSFVVADEGTLTAVAPPRAAGPVAVTVTTPAGTATAARPFAYADTCTVPRLKGRTLRSAKRQIRSADCRVGRPTRKDGATARTGEVVKQVPRPGVTVPADTKVKVTLAPQPGSSQ